MLLRLEEMQITADCRDEPQKDDKVLATGEQGTTVDSRKPNWTPAVALRAQNITLGTSSMVREI